MEPRMLTAAAVATLCAVGLYVSAFMYRKSQRASLGQLAEPSVVESPRARALAGIPNAAFGLAYYAALAAAIPLLGVPPVRWAAMAVALGAAAFSVYLAYSLLFVTRMPCPYCWTAHAVNWALALLLWWPS
jgi:uncharacterized membrane protein